MDEIVLDYRRAMCDLTWRSLLAEQPEMFDFIARTEIDALLEDIEKTAPETAKTCTGMREDFEVCSEARLRSRATCKCISRAFFQL